MDGLIVVIAIALFMFSAFGVGVMVGDYGRDE